ncbi:hypothetical protein [Auritidibacter ignavus]|uniref:hypothetical protein n=1 Tax=Auritidibacter ignavus TaxID=678932 RepID=UPI000F03A208|nr:hypothetical protein [Auritidibacter ignavus]NIH70506.1 hypothetical protein [Auritidibacter ignavus]RMX23305.1 hypothetical protein DYI20_05415 [Auritidibacter ignavus]
MENTTNNQTGTPLFKHTFPAEFFADFGSALTIEIRKLWLDAMEGFRPPWLSEMERLGESLNNAVLGRMRRLQDELRIDLPATRFVQQLSLPNVAPLSISMPSGRTMTATYTGQDTVGVVATPTPTPQEQLEDRVTSLELELQSISKVRFGDELVLILLGWVIGKQLDWLLENVDLESGPSFMAFAFQVWIIIIAELSGRP